MCLRNGETKSGKKKIKEKERKTTRQINSEEGRSYKKKRVRARYNCAACKVVYDVCLDYKCSVSL